MSISEYIKNSVDDLIHRVAEESRRAEHDTSEEGIHDLRVALRRFSETLRVFEDLFPRGAARLVRKEVKRVMRQAGVVRNQDIAIELIARAKVAPAPHIAHDRVKAANQLASKLNVWNEEESFRSWRKVLHV